jgi:hypothetical protein
MLDRMEERRKIAALVRAYRAADKALIDGTENLSLPLDVAVHVVYVPGAGLVERGLFLKG